MSDDRANRELMAKAAREQAAPFLRREIEKFMIAGGSFDEAVAMLKATYGVTDQPPRAR